MYIASVMIGGAEMLPYVLFRGFTITRDLTQRTGRATLLIFARPADIFRPPDPTGSMFAESSFGSAIFGGPTVPPIAILLPGAIVEIWDGSGPTSTGTMFGEATFGSATIGGYTRGLKRFAGTITKITPRAITLADNGLGYTEYTLECQDYTALLDTAVIDPVTLAPGPDRDMVRYIISHTLPDIDTTDVDNIASLDAVTLNGVTARQALESVSALSGGNFWIDENKALHYKSPTATPAPFGISQTPDNATNFYALYEGFTYSEDFASPANRVTVKGGPGTTSVTVDDAASQAQYGRVFSRVISDASLKTSAAISARANVELEKGKQPTKMGKFVTSTQGLDVGQLLPIVVPSLGINGTFLIRRVAMTWITLTETRYAVEFGDWDRDLVRFLRALSLATAAQPIYNSMSVTFDSSSTFTVPDGVVTLNVEIWGPGGDGSIASPIGPGGGGGAYAQSTITVTPGDVLTVTITAGGSELPSWFSDPAVIAAAGGHNGGIGGQASDSVGTTLISGGDGGPIGDGTGGSGANGGGVGGVGQTFTTGNDGTVPGGGGAGGRDFGGHGAHGRVKITY